MSRNGGPGNVAPTRTARHSTQTAPLSKITAQAKHVFPMEPFCALLDTDVIEVIVLMVNQHEDLWAVAQTSKLLPADRVRVESGRARD